MTPIINTDETHGWVTAAVTQVEEGDGGAGLEVEFVCGRLHGWLEVQDGVLGRKLAVWLYDKPNRKVAEWNADEMGGA